jgi:TolB-like protein/DNA-binding winged helix-turn-helix (wHTH) protein
MSVSGETQVLEFGGFSLATRPRLLFGPDGRPVALSARAFDTLLYLAEHPDELVEKHVLMKAVWPNVVVEENNLNQNISIVRRALGEVPGEHKFIVTVPGRGFRFVQPVQRRDAKAGTEVAAAASPPSAATRQRRWTLGVAVAVVLIGVGAYLFIRQPAVVSEDVSSIAVLPFVNISADREQEYFSDGLTEELSSQLGRLNGLRVVGRTSAFAFKGKNQDLRAIGAALGVDHLLEGSVRKSADTVRVTAQLVDSKDGSRLWSETYERKLGDIFSIQDDIAKAVAAALSTRLGDQRDALAGTQNVEAYDAYLVGTARLKVGSTERLRAIADLERAVALDPGYVQAWSTLAEAYYSAPQSLMELSEAEYTPKAQQALSRALELAPDSPRLLAQMTLMTISENRDWSVLERRLESTLDVAGASDFDANMAWAKFLMNVGRPREAVEPLKRAQRAEPLSQGPSIGLHDAYFLSGDTREAEAENRRGAALAGESFLNDAGRVTRAMAVRDRDAIRAFLTKYPGPLNAALIAGLDDPAIALAEIRRLYDTADPKMGATMWGAYGEFAAYFGDQSLALALLNRAFGPGTTLLVIWRPYMSELRHQPGFKDFVKKVRLVEYWRASGKWGEFCRPKGEADFECT